MTAESDDAGAEEYMEMLRRQNNVRKCRAGKMVHGNATQAKQYVEMP